jgi:DMSO/TMAO reductase YedYZ molybdopterin-dependent catalytic subunit
MLRVDGLVARPLELRPTDLASLPRAVLEEPFVCEEGWGVPGLRWGGVRLADVLAIAEPLPTAGYVRAGAGRYVAPVRLAEAADALLSDELNGQPLSVEHGAPWRLVLPGAACYTSVKWLDHLELTAEPGEHTAQRMARARLLTQARSAQS